MLCAEQRDLFIIIHTVEDVSPLVQEASSVRCSLNFSLMRSDRPLIQLALPHGDLDEPPQTVTSDLQMPGRPGGRGLGEDWMEAASPSTGNPKICSSSLASGGGMGKRPMAISTRDRPILQMSD